MARPWAGARSAGWSRAFARGPRQGPPHVTAQECRLMSRAGCTPAGRVAPAIPAWFRVFIGVAEILAAIGLIPPAASGVRPGRTSVADRRPALDDCPDLVSAGVVPRLVGVLVE